MPTPKQAPENSPQGENSDELSPIYNEATMNPPMFEDEWLYLNSIVSIDPIYNPITQSSAEQDED